jgi:hypothetical protein
MYFAFLVGCNKVIPKAILSAESKIHIFNHIMEKYDKTVIFNMNSEYHIEDYDGHYDCYKINKKVWEKLYGEDNCTCICYLIIFESNNNVNELNKMHNAIVKSLY